MHNLKLLVIEFDTFDCSIIFQGCSIQIPTQGDKLTFRFISSGIITWCPKKHVLQEMLFLLLFVACEQHSWGAFVFPKHLPTCHMLLLKTFQNEFLCFHFLNDFFLTKLPCKQNSENISGLQHLLSSLSNFKPVLQTMTIPCQAASSSEERKILAPQSSKEVPLSSILALAPYRYPYYHLRRNVTIQQLPWPMPFPRNITSKSILK